MSCIPEADPVWALGAFLFGYSLCAICAAAFILFYRLDRKR